MEKAVVKTYSAIGFILCIAYLVLCIWGSIAVSGYIWEPSGNSDYSKYMGWSWEEVDVTNVVIVVLAAISFIIPRCAYFLRLWRTGRYSFWLINVRRGWAKVGCLLYDLLDLSLIFALFIMIGSLGNSGAWEGEFVLRDTDKAVVFLLYLIFFAPVYWLCSLVIRVFKFKAKKQLPDNK